MKRILLKTWGLLFLMLFPMLGLSQETLKIGGDWVNEPGNTQACPISLFYKNSISQVIYTQEELSDLSGNMITALSYTLSSQPTKTFSKEIDIYIGKIAMDAFSEERFLSVEGMEKVATVSIGTFSSRTLTLLLDNPYQYDGSSNLMVCMIKRNEPVYENCVFEGFNNGTDGDDIKRQCLFAYTDGSELAAEDISTIDLSGLSNSRKGYGTVRPITTFTYEVQSENAVLKLSQKELDFGWQIAGKNAQKTFKVSNPGKQTLTIGGATIPEGLGTITPDPASMQVAAGGETEFTFNLTDQAGTYSENVVLSAPDAEPTTANLHVSALVYPQTALLESFETSDALPVRFRNRTGKCTVKTAASSAYAGDRYVEFDSYSADTLIFPKLKGSVYVYLKANSTYVTPTVSVLQSADLQQWSELELNTSLTVGYQQLKFDLSSGNPTFFALAGKGFSLDHTLVMEPVYPTHDLAFVSWTVPTVLNEQTQAVFNVVVSNWGSEEETVVLELVDQNNRVLAQKTGAALAAGAQGDYTIEWTPAEADREVSSVQCRIVLANDEDLTNQYSPVKAVKVVPYLPVGVWASEKIFFEPLALGKKDTISVNLSNTGIAPLTVSAVTVSAPFSVVPATAFTVAPGESQEIKVILNAETLTGVQVDTLKMTYNAGMLLLPLVGTVLTDKTLAESFEGDEWPPLAWRKLGSETTTRGWERSEYGAKDGNWYVEQKSTPDTLVTPKLNVKAGEKLLFWAKKSGSELSVLYSANLKEWTELRHYESADFTSTWKGFLVEFPQAGEFYVGFASNQVALDHIQGPEIVVAEKDLRVVGIPVCPAAGNKYADVEYEVSVQNIGALKAEEYTVQLLQGDKVLAEQQGVEVDYLATASIKLVYLPLEEGLMENLRVKVVYEGDADPENNVSTRFNLLVRPEFYGETVVGSEDPTIASNRQKSGFWVSNYDYSLQEFHYSAAQLGIKPGSKIKSISYLTVYQSSDIQTPLTIWMGKKTMQNVATAWSAISDLTQVYEAEITVPKTTGDNTAWGELELSEPYVYEGGDMIIMVERNGKWKNVDFLVNQSTENVRRYYNKDNVSEGIRETALAAGSSDKTYPTLRFVYDMPSIVVSGTVKDENGNAVAEALVLLTNGEVMYRVKTDENGRFTLDMSRTGLDYEISITKEGLFFAKETVSIGSEDIDLGEFEMISNPLKLSLALNGGEGLPLKGLRVELKREGGTKTYTGTATALVAVDTLVFDHLKAGLYNGKVLHSAYKDTTFKVQLEDKDTVLAVRLTQKDPIAVTGKVLSSFTGNGLEGAAVSLRSIAYGLIVSDSTNAEGGYRMDVKMTGKYVRTVTALSYKKSIDTVNIPDVAVCALSDVALRLDNIIVSLRITSSIDLTGAVAVLTNNADAEISFEASLVSGNIFVFDNLLPGVYTLTIRKGENVLYTDAEFEIVADRNEEITLGQSSGSGTLTVKVTTDNGESPAGTEIYLMNDYSGVTYDEWVDATGEREFTGLAFGTYRFGVYKDGFVPHEEMLEFTGDRVVSIELKEHRIAPYALTAEVVYNTDNAQADIEMEWNNIGDYYYDSFEDYEDFAINFKPWTLIDGDGKGTASIRNTHYPHLGEPVAAMVFNPYTTTPPCTNVAFAPLTGAKYLAFFNAVGGTSDDWAIAPKRMIRKGDKLMISFRHLEAGASPERFTICVSTTGTDPEDFMVVSAGNYIASEARWMTFQGDMSSFAGEEVHVAIHYISDQTGGMLMVDDFFIGAVPEDLKDIQAGKWVTKAQEETTYKVYLDGEFKEDVNTNKHVFSNMKPGTYTVGVSQVYKGGESTITTAEVLVEDFKAVSAGWELRLSTNTGISCQAAQVSLTDTAGKSTVYTVNADNKVMVNYLRYGDYTLRVNMAGYDPVSQSLIHRGTSVTEIELKESLTAPSNLFVNVFRSGESYFGTFTWNTVVGFNDGFESYADFTQQIGDWTNIDRDGLRTFGVSNCSFPGMGEPLGAIVYNPSATIPSTSGDNNVRPHSGKKEIVFFSTDQGTPDDWLISPKQNIRDNYQLRFFAKSYSSMYGLESLSVLISETDFEQASFKQVRQITEIPVEWTEYVLDLSDYKGKDIYIAFRYMQANTFFLLLDDVYVGPATDVKNGSKVPTSYNVYLDGKSVGTAIEAEFIFKNLELGRVYEAGVEAVYASGISERSVYSFKVEELATEQLGKAMNTLSVYPNPVRSGNEIHVEVQTMQDYTVRFFNAYGRLVWETGKLHPSMQTVRLPGLPSGMYVIEVQTQEGISYGRLMIL